VTVLAQSAVVRFGNLRYDLHTLSVDADLVLLPGSGTVRCVLPASVRVEAAPGDEAEVTLGNGEREARVLTGTVRGVVRSPGATQVSAVDGAALIAAARPADTLLSMAPAEAIRSLAGDVGAPVGRVTLNPEPLPYYAATQHRTAGEHVAALAELGGGLAAVDGDGRLAAFLRPVPPSDEALRYGREIVDLRVSEERPGADVAVIGSGSAATAGDPRALQPAAGALSGEAGSAASGLVWRPLAALRTPGAVEAAKREARARRGARSRRMTALCWLQPHLRPGNLLDLHDLPSGLPGGPWLLTRVAHRLDRSGGYTRIEAVDGRGDAPSLLSGPLGGLS